MHRSRTSSGAVAPLAPELWLPVLLDVLIIETILVGGAEAYRTGMVDPAGDSPSGIPRVMTRCLPNLVIVEVGSLQIVHVRV